MFATQTFFASLVHLSVFVVGGVLLVSVKVFWFLVYVLLVLSLVGCKISRGGFFSLSRVFFMDLKLTPSSFIFFLFAYIEWQEVTKRF